MSAKRGSAYKRASMILDWFNVESLDNLEPPADLVVVNDIDPSQPEDDDSLDPISLPSISDFKFKSILSHTQPLADIVVEDIQNLVGTYHEYLSTEIHEVAASQRSITNLITDVDHLASQTLATTQARITKANSAARSLKGIDSLAAVAEDAYASMAAIVPLLQAIDDFLPTQERLGTTYSPHKSHYPYLNHLLTSTQRIDGPIQTQLRVSSDTYSSARSVYSVASQSPPLHDDPPRRSISLTNLPSDLLGFSDDEMDAEIHPELNPVEVQVERPTEEVPVNPIQRSLSVYRNSTTASHRLSVAGGLFRPGSSSDSAKDMLERWSSATGHPRRG